MPHNWITIRELEVVSAGRARFIPQKNQWEIDLQNEEKFIITDETFLETFQVVGVEE